MKSTVHKYIVLCIATIAALVLAPLTTRKTAWQKPVTSLRCVIDLKGEPVRGLTVGMNKIILREFADEYGLDLEFLTPADSSDYLDSLRDGTVDLLVMYRADSLHEDGLISTLPYRDSTVWVLSEAQAPEIRRLNTWLTSMTANGGLVKIGKTYLRRVGSSLTSISPYDHLIKQNAEKNGLDWRLVCAVIYKESRFINESCSDAGAVGLMQVLSGEKYSVDTLLDPAVNIAIGTDYLSRLSRMFAEYAADSVENVKFTLASYNAGEGTLLKCIHTAEDLGTDPSHWDSIVSILPKVPGFGGRETIAFVREVLDTYEEYAEVYPR